MSPKRVWRRLVEGPDPRPRQALKAIVLGLLACHVGAAVGLVLPWAFKPLTAPAYVLCALAALVGPVWLRRAYWLALAGLVTLTLVIGYTPLAPALLRPLIESDQPVPADAIVVLSAATQSASFNSGSEDRFLRGLELLHAGWAPAIVFTGDPPHPGNQFHVLAPAMMAALGLSTAAVVPFEAVDTSLMNTYTEAQSVRLMADRHGWRHILLVTSPSHTRRAAATFRKTGLEVTPVASEVTRYDLLEPDSVGDRMAIFRDWIYEAAAILTYRLRGRI